jgi:hypothetical protein
MWWAAMPDGADKSGRRPSKNLFFGINLEEYIPVDTFPYDPDNSFKRGRKWTVNVIQFSPILEQRFVLAESPLITYEVGFDVLKGDVQDPTSRAATLWAFFQEHRGRATMFWYFDPVPWGFYPDPYRSNPASRLTHPTDATVGRYIALFDDDEMDSETFEWRLQRTQLKMSMYPG